MSSAYRVRKSQVLGRRDKVDIRDKEMLAVVRACRKFRHWLVGRKVKVFTDHESLSTLLKGSNVMPSDRIARQVEFLATFDLDIVYLKGSSNEVADALSRLPSASLKASKLATTAGPCQFQKIGWAL